MSTYLRFNFHGAVNAVGSKNQDILELVSRADISDRNKE